jgi:hypothetical protein
MTGWGRAHLSRYGGSRRLGQYGRTLTVLTCESLTAQASGDESDEDGEAELTESWTPNFDGSAAV